MLHKAARWEEMNKEWSSTKLHDVIRRAILPFQMIVASDPCIRQVGQCVGQCSMFNP